MFCQKCGTPNRKNAEACVHCGARFAVRHEGPSKPRRARPGVPARPPVSDRIDSDDLPTEVAVRAAPTRRPELPTVEMRRPEVRATGEGVAPRAPSRDLSTLRDGDEWRDVATAGRSPMEPPRAAHASLVDDLDDRAPMGVAALPAAICIEADSEPPPVGTASDEVLTLPSTTRRALASCIDAILIVLLGAFAASVDLFGSPLSDAVRSFDLDLALSTPRALALPVASLCVLALVLSTLLHALFGRTVGKFALGLRLVTRATGERPSAIRVVLRAVLGVIGGLAAGVGYYWIVADSESCAMHDRLTGTVVVSLA